jgi:HNH endonuclease/Helix-turn-helix domain of resolvase
MRLDFCVACGSLDALHHHHLVPRVEGGPDDDSNLITLCQGCHGKVHGRTFWRHREMQRAGIEKAKAAGVYKGRPASIKAGSLAELKAEGMGATDIAQYLKISRASVYRVLGADANPERQSEQKVNKPDDAPRPVRPIQQSLFPIS